MEFCGAEFFGIGLMSVVREKVGGRVARRLERNESVKDYRSSGKEGWMTY